MTPGHAEARTEVGIPQRRLSVVIPTYQRPEWIKRAILSLARQLPLPSEVIAVARDTDTTTHQSVKDMQAGSLPFPVHLGMVSEAGFMPPVQEGFRLAAGDVIAVMDDDAEAEPDWVAGLLRHYDDQAVGGVGGRCINMDRERPVETSSTCRVGYVTPLGHFVGGMYLIPTFQGPVDVAFLMGGCMSFRAEVVRRLELDLHLNRSVAFGYEVDLGLQVGKMGLRLVFDPNVAIRHYSAPRAEAGMRDPGNADAVKWSSYNDARVALRRLGLLQATVGWVHRLLLGSRRAPGLVPWLLAPLGRRLGFELRVAKSAAAGRLEAARDVIREGRPKRAG